MHRPRRETVPEEFFSCVTLQLQILCKASEAGLCDAIAARERGFLVPLSTIFSHGPFFRTF